MARSGAGKGPGTGSRSWREASIRCWSEPRFRAIARCAGRYIEAAVNGVLVGCLYLPNGNPQPGPKFDYKLAGSTACQRHAAKLCQADMPVVLAGDYNVAPTVVDIYPTRSWDNDALVQPESREAFARLVATGLD